jgi:hypothetical protein
MALLTRTGRRAREPYLSESLLAATQPPSRPPVAVGPGPSGPRDARFFTVAGLGTQPGDVDHFGRVRVITGQDDMGVWVEPADLRGAGW